MDIVDFTRFQWKQDGENPGRYKREAAGGERIEDIWNLTKHGEQNLFLGVYASLTAPLSTADFVKHLEGAWKSLRWAVPTIAAGTAHIWNEGGPPTTFITYDVAKSADEVNAWAQSTLEVKEGFKDLDVLRYEIGQDSIPATDLATQTFLYVVPWSATSYGVMIRTSHVVVDGAGIKIWMTKLFDYLTQYISDPGYAAAQAKLMQWGTEASNLLPVITEILRKHEPAVVDAQGNIEKPELPAEIREGPEYFSTLNDVMTGLATGGPRSHPFKSFIQPPFDPQLAKPKTRRLQHAFSVEDSVKIKAAGAVSSSIPEKLTVNHLVHGALSLIPIFDNPPTPDSEAVVFYYGIVDGRQRLDKAYRGPLDYPGYCLGMSAVQIPVALFQSLPKDDDKTMVLEFAKVVQKEYRKQAVLPSLIAIEPQQVEMMLSVPPPPPWSGPAYAADGRGQVYLRPKYPEGGPTVIEIDDFFVGLNKCDPGPFFRAYEWKGKLILSADFNELAVETKVVQGWIDQWAHLLLALTV